MKTKSSFLAAIIILLFSAWTVPATSEKSVSVLSVKKEKKFPPEFAFFRTHRQGQGIMATWGLTTNQSISGFVVQKTYEDPNDPYSNWENICAIPCGAERSFKHHDLNISPGFISYRVIAYFQYGGSLMSLTCTEHIVSH
jgi:hypothetical protein